MDRGRQLADKDRCKYITVSGLEDCTVQSRMYDIDVTGYENRYK